MATCNTTIDNFQAIDGSLDIVDKYKDLMQATLSDDSLYARAKETFYSVFDELGVNEDERAKLVSSYMVEMSTSLSASAMQSALQWAKEERDGAYALAKVKADTELSLAQFEKVKSDICLTDKQTELACAQVEATIAGSIRENGRVATYDADGCKPTALIAEGLKYEQTKQVEASTYQIHADAYRKSGVVQIGEDLNDNVVKGLSGDDYGYTDQQIKNAERQRIAYEDSKRNHAANSSSAMIGQMLTAEIAPNEADIDRWREAVDYLNSNHSSTSNP